MPEFEIIISYDLVDEASLALHRLTGSKNGKFIQEVYNYRNDKSLAPFAVRVETQDIEVDEIRNYVQGLLANPHVTDVDQRQKEKETVTGRQQG